MPFQSFQSGCGTCNASTDYPDIYYSQNPTLASNTVPQGPSQSGAGKKKTKVSKKKSSTKVSKKKSSTKVSKKKSTTKVSKKKRSMRGGASESSFQLDDQFIRDNLGISFETVGGATYMPPQYYKGGVLDSLRTGTMAGFDANEHKYSALGGAKGKKKSTVTKKKTTSKKVVKKSTSTKKKTTSPKVVKKSTSTKKKMTSSWKFW